MGCSIFKNQIISTKFEESQQPWLDEFPIASWIGRWVSLSRRFMELGDNDDKQDGKINKILDRGLSAEVANCP